MTVAIYARKSTNQSGCQRAELVGGANQTAQSFKKFGFGEANRSSLRCQASEGW